jgi:hypothetical protein
MLHQLVFQSLLGEIDYGAMGDFNTAGCVPPRTPGIGWPCAAGVAQGVPGRVVWGSALEPGNPARGGGGKRGGGYSSDAVGVVQFQPGQHLVVERPRRRLDLPGNQSCDRSRVHMATGRVFVDFARCERLRAPAGLWWGPAGRAGLSAQLSGRPHTGARRWNRGHGRMLSASPFVCRAAPTPPT